MAIFYNPNRKKGLFYIPSGATGGDRLAIQYSAARFCEDGIDPIPGITGDTGGTFSSTTGLVFISTSTGQVDLSASTPGSYVVTYTAPSFDTATTSISIDSIPVVSAGADVAICTGNSTVLTATGATTYSWSTGETTASITVDPTTNTTYTVTGFNGACSATDSVDVTVYPLPSVSISGTLTYCAGSTTTLTATAGLSSYLWSTGATTQSINVTAGSYTVTGTDSNGCSATSSASTVVEYPLPTVSISGTLEFCAGQSTVLTATAGLSSYLWSNGETTQAITVTSGGSYSVTGTDSNGCSNNDSVSVTEHALPTVSISGTLSFCAGANTILTASGASTYLWSTGETTASITVSTGGSYSVTGTDANGCSALDSASVTEYSLPSVSISGTLSYCAGASTTLDAGAGFASYSWSSGETTQTISATAGNYTVTVTDSNGCSNTSAQVTVTELALPTVAISGTLSYCAGSNTTLTATAGLSSYLWSSGETTQSITATAGSYTVTGTDANGCSNTSSSVTVTETPLDNAGFSYSESSYEPTDADPTPTITGLAGGTFSAGSGLVFVDSGTNTGSSTGEIDLSASTVASYTITYDTTSSGSSVCPNTSTQTVEIAVAGIANNYSMSFDGTDDYIETGFNGLNGVSEATISIWAKTSNVTLGRFMYGNRDTSGNGVACQTWTDGRIYFYVSSASSLIFNMASAGIQNNEWFNLVFVYNGSQSSNTDKVKIYVNKNLITYTTSSTFPTTLQTSSKSFKIGNDEQANAYWNGQIDELGIWNTALTASQVQSIYDATSTNLTKDLTTVSGSNLIYWNRMGDN